jgi:hypothetical protein
MFDTPRPTTTPEPVPCPEGCATECLAGCDAWAARGEWDAAGRPPMPWGPKKQKPAT